MNLQDLRRPFLAKTRRDPMTGCWVWTSSVDGRGYAKACFGGRALIASRLSVRISGREIPPGHVVCHACDNKLCVNPEHLFVGTQADNIRDMHAKGRAAVGEKMPTASLTDAQVRGIRFLATLGRKQNVMARQYGVSKMVINRVVNRKSWKHVS